MLCMKQRSMSLFEAVGDCELLFGQHTKLAAVLKDMGFHYSKIRYYYEQPKIIQQRHTYLCKMVQNRADNRQVVFLDETWVNSHDGNDLVRKILQGVH